MMSLREGWAINHKSRTSALSRARPSIAEQKSERKVVTKLRKDRVMAAAPNECWCNGRSAGEPGVLTIVDICAKLCPAMGVAPASKGHDLVATPEIAAREHGRPKRLKGGLESSERST